MTARIIDGTALSARVRGEIAERAAALTARGVQPCLAVMLVGADPASAVYVRNKVAGCEKAGIRSLRFDYPETATQEEVMARLAELNADPAVHGILVQLPLPRHLDEVAVLEAIAIEKDVDGFHAENVGRLSQNREGFIPCTPHGVMKMLETGDTPVQGAEGGHVGVEILGGARGDGGDGLAEGQLAPGRTLTLNIGGDHKGAARIHVNARH